MNKKLIILLTIFVTIICFIPQKAEATTMRDLYNELAEIEAEKNQTVEDKQKEAEKIGKYRNEINTSQQVITNSQNEIISTQNKIYELNIEIEEKNIEIENLIHFNQLSSGDNEYLEYIFDASDFTDFIYRSAIVEQLSEYNKNLIQDMYNMIEENKKLATDLQIKIENEKHATDEFKKMLASHQISFNAYAKAEEISDAEIKAKEKQIKYLEGEGCKMDDDLSKCIKIPLSTGKFIKPVLHGLVTSNYGNRSLGYHRGIDIGLSMRTPVYASANGRVAYTVYDRGTAGGGTKVVLYHILNGVSYTTQYMHLDSYTVSPDDIVFQGELIGYSGNTGRSTGPHLHFQFHEGHNTFSSTTFDPRRLVIFPAKDSRF